MKKNINYPKWKICQPIFDGEHGLLLKDGEKIKVKVYGKDVNEILLNASIIEAAPELLEACLNLENDDNSIPDHAWNMIQEAIKKAIK